MMSRALLTVLALTVAACQYEDTLQQAYGYPALPGDTTEALTDAPTTAVETTTDGGSSGPIMTVTGGVITDTGDSATGADASTSDDAIPPPAILAIDMPVKVTAAGPVDVVVLAKNATTLRGVLDDGETFYFKSEGDVDGDGADSFVATFPIFGAVDNGQHDLEIIAERGDLEDRLTRPFDVATPAAGILAWERYGGSGSRTTRLALDAEGFVYEGGALEIGETERPAVRKRDPVNGGDLWPGGSITLDIREGSVADLALTPEGRLWVAMNVREGNTWRARIALFEPNGQPTGITFEKPGATVTAIDSDGDGGCIAVGYAVTLHGDADVMIWRVTGDGTPIASGQPWGYEPDEKPHTFTDLAFDVVVDTETNEAWIVGASQGKHDANDIKLYGRGMILRVDMDTLEVLGVVIAPPLGTMVQSVFYGAALGPEGVLVTGNECDLTCTMQRISATRYHLGDFWSIIYTSPLTSVAFGSSIVRNAHGAVLIAANVKDGTTMRGRLLGHHDGIGGEKFAPLTFPGNGASVAASVVVGPYDRALCGGEATVDGAAEGYVMRPHQ